MLLCRLFVICIYLRLSEYGWGNAILAFQPRPDGTALDAGAFGEVGVTEVSVSADKLNKLLEDKSNGVQRYHHLRAIDTIENAKSFGRGFTRMRIKIFSECSMFLICG
jgi:hypothetical protein